MDPAPAPPVKAPNRWSVWDYLKIGFRGMPANALGGIDVTYRCNLRCRHCYFIKQNYHAELTDEQWLARFEDLRQHGFPFLICGWLGGEPLLRKELIGRARRYFKSNVVFTNGTIELPPWPDVTFSVSVHGTAESYYRMTGAPPGTYDKVRRNVDRPDLDVVLAFCVTRINQSCIEAMAEEWHHSSVRGIVFEFYTPTRGEGDGLWLHWKERDRVLERLRVLKQTYGDFVAVSDLVLWLMRSERSRDITRRCPFPNFGFSWDPLGQPKHPCQLGKAADCSRCGCILPFYSTVLTRRRLLIPEFVRSVKRRLVNSKRG